VIGREVFMAVNWDAARREAENDPRSTQELIELILEADEDAAWDTVWLLQKRGSREVFEAASALCHSSDTQKQSWGIRILGQLGVPNRSFPVETVDLLLKMLEQERNPALIAEIAFALGHQHSSRGIPPLSRLRAHPDAEVRYSVVHGLLRHEDPLAIQTLIELSADEDRDVRDWATFGLGTQVETDTRAVREALLARLADEDEETRAEAMVGLATRKDGRVIEPLIRELSAERVGSLFVEAAQAIGDPRLLPSLLALRERRGEPDPELEAALADCIKGTT
jgi:HEAT repeat protein